MALGRTMAPLWSQKSFYFMVNLWFQLLHRYTLFMFLDKVPLSPYVAQTNFNLRILLPHTEKCLIHDRCFKYFLFKSGWKENIPCILLLYSAFFLWPIASDNFCLQPFYLVNQLFHHLHLWVLDDNSLSLQWVNISKARLWWSWNFSLHAPNTI